MWISLLYWFPFFHFDAANHLQLASIGHTRILGVLQRIALAYCIASLLNLLFSNREPLSAYRFRSCYCTGPFMMMGGNAPDPLAMTGNLSYKLDMWLMGPDHMYHGEGMAFDPEGWLSTLPSVVNVTFGYMVGKIYTGEREKHLKDLTKLLLLGFALIVIGYFWDLSFPINKKLWTSSFVVYTVGIDCVIISAIIYVVDFLGRTKWTWFFTIFGKNPLFIYLLSEVGATILEIIPHKTRFKVWAFMALS